MEVILLQDVETLGTSGDIIVVKPGYARNFLFPRSLAVRSSKRNRALADEKKKVAKSRALREAKSYEELISNLKKTEITIEVQVGGEDRLFGSVTSQDIHKALAGKGIEVDRHAILLEEPIKALGIYDVPVKITKGLNQEVKVYIIQA
ncbi:MAG: 50S ribosomal protein L9 [Candidatus Marinimicrobia bacterium]|jgi:large subunit ribosomal protein L9|nr:50S ribosomal protein L9 [Candidatus Neomarinimicrobiota bacterium]MBT3675155.1 50S ribosomal protein L9 [Candidatus Neomarinimicrobiota bacterium]MBT3763865.1 50S ribosomal protein L9 [Candidatus Neomarinimicrobiota bacterium]MBT4067994.1 50S ribosomal protein L9 [Candidatus Neomarinimicrobiota bacterium]MBT4271227.1 50S ribosomal protein L9 [Candidatus Neomarinimicrobiota bacterium]